MDVMDTLLHRPNAEAHFQAPFDSAQSRSSTQATEVSLHLMGPCIGVCVCVCVRARVLVCVISLGHPCHPPGCWHSDAASPLTL